MAGSKNWEMIGEYKKNLKNLIHDMRRDFNATNLSVIIGELGVVLTQLRLTSFWPFAKSKKR
jgi:hypothetical protein